MPVYVGKIFLILKMYGSMRLIQQVDVQGLAVVYMGPIQNGL